MGHPPARPAANDDSSPGSGLDVADVVRATSADVWRFHAHQFGVTDADDLSQETYLRVLRALPAFRGESSVRVWVLAIAARVAADEIRRRQRVTRMTARIASRPAPVADQSEEHALIDLVSGLEPSRREAFVLTQLLQLSYADAAQLVGCPVGSIRSRVARARADLIKACDPDASA